MKSANGRLSKKITFVDLFAGIGGFHIAFNNLDAKCVLVSEWDKSARYTYEHNFRKVEPELFDKGRFYGDLKEINYENMPDFDILTAGFPCQPFSLAGKQLGFSETRGTLFNELLKIIDAKEPKAFFLENVRHLLKHDKGRTIRIIERELRKRRYSFHKELVKATDFGLPTHRTRLFMIGFKDDPNDKIPFEFPKPLKTKVKTLTEFFGYKWNKDIAFTLRVGGTGSGIHDRRNWDTYIIEGVERRIKKEEGLKLMGFPSYFEFPLTVTDAQAMRQLGNSVAVSAIQATAENVTNLVRKYYQTPHSSPQSKKSDINDDNYRTIFLNPAD